MRFAEIRNTQLELHYFQLRLGVAGVIVVVAFAILFARFFYLQVIQHQYYDTKAEDNRISIVPLQPNRGLIVDRNGVVLARNYSAYTLELTLSKIPDLEATIDALSEIVDIQPKDRRRFQRLREEPKRPDSLPIRTRLTDEEVAKLAVNRYRFLGVDIKGRLFRQYPLAKALRTWWVTSAGSTTATSSALRRWINWPTTRAPTTSGKRALSRATRAHCTAPLASDRSKRMQAGAS